MFARLCSRQASPPLKHSFFTSLSYAAEQSTEGFRGGRGQAHPHLLSSAGHELLTSGSHSLALLQNLLFVVSLNSEQPEPL